MSLIERVLLITGKQKLYLVGATRVSPESYYTGFNAEGVIPANCSELALPQGRFKLVGRWVEGEFERSGSDGGNHEVGKPELSLDFEGLGPEAVIVADGRIFLHEELVRRFKEEDGEELNNFCQRLVDDLVQENGGFVGNR